MSDDEPSDMAVQRAIGRLEGRMTSLEVRVNESVIRTDRQMSAVTGEVMDLRGDIRGIRDKLPDFEALKIDMASLSKTVLEARGRVSGGWHVLVIISMVVVTFIQTALAIFSAYHR